MWVWGGKLIVADSWRQLQIILQAGDVFTSINLLINLPGTSELSPDVAGVLPGWRPVLRFFLFSLEASDSMMSTRRVSTLAVMETFDPSCSRAPPVTCKFRQYTVVYQIVHNIASHKHIWYIHMNWVCNLWGCFEVY